MTSSRGRKDMDILVIGGTQFLGRYVVSSAISSGHKITMFNRGKSNFDLFPEVETIVGDRSTNDLEKLKYRKWDIVIDTCGYFPIDLENISQILKNNIGKYIFISSCSVYDLNFEGYANENAKTVTMPDKADPNERNFEHYGAKKFLCENKVVNNFGEQHSIIIRPGLIVGPHDQSYRFPYWPERFNEGGEILAPGKPTSPVQIIDVRDLAEWIVSLANKSRSGVFNAVGPTDLNKETFFTICQKTIKKEVALKWISEDILLENNVKPWLEIPLWLTDDDIGMFKISNQKAITEGLAYRQIETTILDTLNWSLTKTDEKYRSNALTRELEHEIIRSVKRG